MLFKSVFITSVTVPGTVQDTESTEIYKVLSQSWVDISLHVEKTNKQITKTTKKYVKENKEEEEIDKKKKQEKKEKAITVK